MMGCLIYLSRSEVLRDILKQYMYEFNQQYRTLSDGADRLLLLNWV